MINRDNMLELTRRMTSQEEPMAFIEVRLFGGPDKQAFSKMTAEITKISGEVLGIAPDHMYIKYSATADWGWNGGNF